MLKNTHVVVYIIMLICVTTSLTISGSSNFYTLDVIATPSITILPDNEDDEELDYGQNEIEE
jgi:hypothetical protein